MQKQCYTFIFLIWVLFSTRPAAAQIGGLHVVDGVIDISKNDSTVFTFLGPDSLTHTYLTGSVSIDTTGAVLWQIGTTTKTFFADSGFSSTGIMTDTTDFYPVNANEGFVLRLEHNGYNTIVGFDHKFQTAAGLDGGVVEFSADEGLTWQNVLGDCNKDDNPDWLGVYTDSFYSKTDTLWNGEAGFSGNSGGWLHSRFQFFNGWPLKGGASCFLWNPLYVRFRFVSDSTAEELAGWLIGNIKIENDYYGSSLSRVQPVPALSVIPNPSRGIFHFPDLGASGNFKLVIRTAQGQIIWQQPYAQHINLNAFPNGLYFYEVSNGRQAYRGKLLKY